MRCALSWLSRAVACARRISWVPHDSVDTLRQVLSTRLDVIALRQDRKPQHLGQPEGVVPVVGVFQAAVLLYLCGIGQAHVIAFRHRRVHQPIPVVGGLDDHAGNSAFVRFQRGQDRRFVVGQLLLVDTAAGSCLNAGLYLCTISCDTSKVKMGVFTLRAYQNLIRSGMLGGATYMIIRS